MNIFEGQIRHAQEVFKLHKSIPERLQGYLRFRPKATGITLVSFFEFAPMRGLDLKAVRNNDSINRTLNVLNKHADFLLSPLKSDDEKIKILGKLGFKTRGKTQEEYLEEDVQAFVIREILGGNYMSVPAAMSTGLRLVGLEYLTSEFEWSDKGKKERIDVVCLDKQDSCKVIILELKKIRTTNLKQYTYKPFLQKNQAEFRQFISALKGLDLSNRELEIRMMYLMPSHPRLVENRWKEIIHKFHLDGILFYKVGFPPDRLILPDR